MAFPNTFAALTGPIPTSKLDENFGAMLDNSNAAKGSGLMLFNSDLAYAEGTSGAKLRQRISPTDHPYNASRLGVLDATAAINAALAANSRVHLPAGVYLVDPAVGLKLRTGTVLTGDGKNKTILLAKAGGASTAGLAGYNTGAVIRRDFNPAPAANDYVNEVYIADIGIVLTHPTSSVTTTAIQIGIDLRNVTRSIVERVHIGNIAPVGGAYTKATNGAYDVQGYGIVVGNVSSSASSYAGGEVNTIRDCSVWGAFKAIVIDDATLSPNSSAHATTVANCDLQIAHHLQVQESRYAAGCAFRDNVLQSVVKKPGDSSAGYVARIDGYNCEMSGGYIESGGSADYLVYLGPNSLNNRVRLAYYSATNLAAITDASAQNAIEYFENSGAISGGVDSLGAPVRLYRGAYESAWIKFRWDGSSIVIDGSFGVQSVTRTTTGDYVITWAKSFPTDDYALSVLLDTNASGHMGGFSVGSHAANNVRIYTYAQNGGTTTGIDPRFVWVRAALR